MNTYRMNEIVKMIRKSAVGHVNLVVDGVVLPVGFADGGPYAALIMLGGGYYVITESNGTKHNIAKGQLIEIA